MKYAFFLYPTLILAALAGTASADVSLAPFFRDGAVLQRDKTLPIWGQASPGEHVSVAFHDQKAESTAGPDRRWRVDLKAEPASSNPSEIVVTGKNTLRVTNVLVGDVWLCGGQSNMEFALGQGMSFGWRQPGVLNARAEIAAASYPLIRQMIIPHEVAEHPADEVAGEWVACSPATAADFTAVGYFFARDWFHRTGVPVGLLNDNWGGTQIESWMSDEALRADPAATAIFGRWETFLHAYPARLAVYETHAKAWDGQAAAAKAAAREPFPPSRPIPPSPSGGQARPSGLYNAMIHPFVPAAIRGFLWYQGEANGQRGAEYRNLFPEMIRQWRQDFGQGELPFYFVQLADYGSKDQGWKDNWAFLREAQAGALSLPFTGMAVTIDIGNPDNIHPIYKQEVGRRLALWARSQLLGEKLEYSGPVFQGVRREGSSLNVSFSHAEGLYLRGEPTSFEVAGADGKFVTARAHLDGKTLVVVAAYPNAVTSEPVAVRYAWRNVPMACLFNGAGLPAAPFRSDQER